jgi:hypothetical protein
MVVENKEKVVQLLWKQAKEFQNLFDSSDYSLFMLVSEFHILSQLCRYWWSPPLIRKSKMPLK